MQQVARYEGIGELHILYLFYLNHNVLATSGKSSLFVSTLRGNRKSRIGVKSFVQQVARYGASYNALPLHYE